MIYYVRDRKGIIWMLTIYGKSVQENIPGHLLRKIRKELDSE